MSFTYNFTTDPLLSTVRLIIGDTVSASAIFQDDEINQALYVTSSQGLFVSGQASPIPNGVQVPPTPQIYSVFQAAALLADSIASTAARAAAVTQLLDVKLDPAVSQKAWRDQAKAWRDYDDRRGQFAIAEMVQDPFTARARVVKQFQRLYGGY